MCVAPFNRIHSTPPVPSLKWVADYLICANVRTFNDVVAKPNKPHCSWKQAMHIQRELQYYCSKLNRHRFRPKPMEPDVWVESQ